MTSSFLERHQALITLNISAFFVFFATAIIRSLPVSIFDSAFADFAEQWQTAIGLILMGWVSQAFHPLALAFITMIIVLVLMVRRRFLWAGFFLFSMVLATLSALLAKDVFSVARPISLGPSPWGWSFPSLHATVVAVFFLSIVFWIEEKIHQHTVIFFWATVSSFLVFLVGLSRIYLSVHWLSDVLGGFAVGVFWATFSLVCLERVKDHYRL